jgi:hypothetical protein
MGIVSSMLWEAMRLRLTSRLLADVKHDKARA